MKPSEGKTPFDPRHDTKWVNELPCGSQCPISCALFLKLCSQSHNTKLKLLTWIFTQKYEQTDGSFISISWHQEDSIRRSLIVTKTASGLGSRSTSGDYSSTFTNKYFPSSLDNMNKLHVNISFNSFVNDLQTVIKRSFSAGAIKYT